MICFCEWQPLSSQHWPPYCKWHNKRPYPPSHAHHFLTEPRHTLQTMQSYTVYTPSTRNEPRHLHWATHSPMSYTVYTPSTPNEPRHLHWATHSLMSYTVYIHHLQYSKWATPSPLSHAFSNELHAIYSNWALTTEPHHIAFLWVRPLSLWTQISQLGLCAGSWRTHAGKWAPVHWA